MWMPGAHKGQNWAWSPKIEVIYNRVPPCMYVQLDLSPLQQQELLLTYESSLRPLNKHCIISMTEYLTEAT